MELQGNYPFLEEDHLIPKTEPIDIDLIKKEGEEEEEGEFFVVIGLVENEEIENCSSTKV